MHITFRTVCIVQSSFMAIWHTPVKHFATSTLYLMNASMTSPDLKFNQGVYLSAFDNRNGWWIAIHLWHGTFSNCEIHFTQIIVCFPRQSTVQQDTNIYCSHVLEVLHVLTPVGGMCCIFLSGFYGIRQFHIVGHGLLSWPSKCYDIGLLVAFSVTQNLVPVFIHLSTLNCHSFLLNRSTPCQHMQPLHCTHSI